VDRVLDVLSTMGSTALAVVAGLLALFVLFKFIERKRFRATMQVERISMDELVGLIEAGHEPLLVDARSATAQQLEEAIPGALPYNGGAAIPEITAFGTDRYIVVYCSCPDDITAAAVAKQLHSQGFHLARPLRGGLEAWKAFTETMGNAVPGTLAPSLSR
jgi:rhodanese-related sulfurtransferase